MPGIEIDLPAEAVAAVSACQADEGLDDQEAALRMIVLDWLIGHGYLASDFGAALADQDKNGTGREDGCNGEKPENRSERPER